MYYKNVYLWLKYTYEKILGVSYMKGVKQK